MGTGARRGRLTTGPGAVWVVAGAVALLFVAGRFAARPIRSVPRIPATNLADRVASGQAAPQLVTTASGPIRVGGALQGAATLSGGLSPTGAITFLLYGPSDPACGGPPVFTAAAAVSGNGTYRSGAYVPPRPGLYRWTAQFSGDADNLPVADACPAGGATSAVLIGVPTLLTAAAPSAPLGGALSDVAMLSGGANPTGTLVFSVFGPADTTCSGPPLATLPPVRVVGAGTYSSAPVVATAVGTYRFEVHYSGDVNNVALESRCEDTNQATTVAPTLTIVGRPPPPPVVGEAIVGAETLAGGDNPSGTITLSVYGPNDSSCAGSPAFTLPPVTVTGNGVFTSAPFVPQVPGFYTIVARYSGDANNAPQQTPCQALDQTISVFRAIPSLLSPTTPQAAVGHAIRADETLSDALHPTGTIAFSFYGPSDASCTGRPVLAAPPEAVTGNATYRSPPFVPPGPGVYRFVATYSGDARNIAMRTDCNAVNQAVLASILGLYVPSDHPRAVIELEVVAFALLAVAGAGRAGTTSQAGTTSPARPKTAKSSASSSSSQGSVVSTGLDNTSEGWEAVAVVAAADAAVAGEDRRGAVARTWRWPGTRRIDEVSMRLPSRVAPASPLLARIANDGGYLRAMFGSASAVLVLVGIALAAVGLHEVHGRALPPPFVVAMALAVIGVLDAMAGAVAVAVFVVGVAALGGVANGNDARTLLGLSTLWFAAPVIAGAARPLRRAPTASLAEHVERIADVVVAALVGAWAVKEILEGLPGLSGRALSIAGQSNEAALVVLVALSVRMVAETVAAHQYRRRLAEVQSESLPGSGRAQHVSSALVALAVFVFVALPYVGPSWQLYLGGVFFFVPFMLGVFSEHLPNLPRLYAVIPRGIAQAVAMLVVGTAFGALVAAQLGRQTNQQVIRESFLLLSLPGLAVSILKVFGRDGPEPPKIHWLPEKMLGATLIAVGILFVMGVVTI